MKPAATRTEAHGTVGLGELTRGLPAECVAYWRHRTVYSKNGRIRGVVVAVRPCLHRGLCDGVALEVFWGDGLRTFHCSYDSVADGDGRHALWT